MSQLGERLRATRESQGISVAQASVETRILQRYLVALEDGDYQHLPGDVYARGFIRNYAEYLDLPAEECIEQYRRERGVTDQIRVVPAMSSPRIRGLFVPSFFGVFFVVLILVGFSYLALNLTSQIGGSDTTVADAPTPTVPPPSPLPTSPAAPTDEPLVATVPASDLPPTQAPAGGGVAPESPPPTPTLEGRIVGEVRIAGGEHRGSWMQIVLDGQTAFEGILGPDATRSFTAQRDVRILAGNAGVVYVRFNGQEQGPLGRAGEVVTFNWPPQ